MRGTRKVAAAILLALAGSPVAWAQTAPAPTPAPDPLAPPAQSPPRLDWAFGAMLSHTDNIGRTSTDPTSQNILQPTFNFTFNQQGSTVQAQVTGLLQYNDYLENYYGNDLFGELAGTFNWTISPQRLNFFLQDNASVQPVNTRLADAPSNQQQVNVLIAGPTFLFRLGDSGAWHGQADLRYINTAASKTKDFDSQRGMGALRLIRDLSVTSNLSANLDAYNVDPSNVDPQAGASRYNQYDLYARYTSRLQHLGIDLSAGATRIDFAQEWGNHSGPLLRGSIAWRFDTRNTLQISAANDITDSTSGLVNQPIFADTDLLGPGVQVGNAVISSAVFRERTLNVGYTFTGPRFSITAGSYYQRLRQINGTDQSQNDYGAMLDATWQLQPLMTLGASAGYQVVQYEYNPSRSRTPIYGINLSRQLTPHWSWSVQFRHGQRLDSEPGSGYSENAVFAVLYYKR